MQLKQIYTQYNRHVCQISEVESRKYLGRNSNTDFPSNYFVQQHENYLIHQNNNGWQCQQEPRCPQNLCLPIFLLTLHLSLFLHLALFSHIKRKEYTIVHCKQVSSVTDCDYSEQTDLTEKMIILITILVILKNARIEMKELFLHMPTIYSTCHQVLVCTMSINTYFQESGSEVNLNVT
jgi:hypothetical protein